MDLNPATAAIVAEKSMVMVFSFSVHLESRVQRHCVILNERAQCHGKGEISVWSYAYSVLALVLSVHIFA